MKKLNLTRRDLIKSSAALGVVPAAGLLTACETMAKHHGGKHKPHVVVVGGGFGGATCARYLKKYQPDLKVTLIEPKKPIQPVRVVTGILQDSPHLRASPTTTAIWPVSASTLCMTGLQALTRKASPFP